MRKIIDISTAQGYIHWHIVKEEAGLDRVIAKACDGIWEDRNTSNGATFSDTARRALEMGIPLTDAYGFYYLPRPDQDGQAQARSLLRLAYKGFGLQPVGDFEPPLGTIWKAAYTEDLRIYFDTLDQALGELVPLYSGQPYLDFLAIRAADRLYDWPDFLRERPVFFSAYPYRLPYRGQSLPAGEQFNQWNLAHRTYSRPIKPDYWRSWPGIPTLWQFDDHGTIPGITGIPGIPGNSVDLDTDWPPEAEPEPKPQPEAAPGRKRYQVLATARPNVRSGPSTSYAPPLGTLEPNTIIEVDQDIVNGYAHYAGLDHKPVSGWVYISYIKEN